MGTDYQIKLSKLRASAESISKLLYPFAEVVIHDIKSDTILEIYNSFSKRRPKDRSYIEESFINTTNDWIGPYSKNNWDGRKLKSLTLLERDLAGKPILLQCINIDISFFQNAQNQINLFLEFQHDSHSEDLTSLFGENIYEKINNFVSSWCNQNKLSLAHLTKTEKLTLIQNLQQNGAFNHKKAAEYVGRVLSISRASVYNYLKERL